MKPSVIVLLILATPLLASVATAQVTLAVGNASVDEGDPGGSVTLDFPVTISGGPTTEDVSVSYVTVMNGTATGDDYVEAVGNATFLAGEASGVISIEIKEDLHVEPDETFDISLSMPFNATITDGDATGTILDDEDPVALSVGDFSVSEGDPGSSVTLDFPVTIAGPTTTKPVIVDYVTVMNGTASGSDYVEAIGFATFPAGAPSGVISIQIKEDLHVESDETFDISLSTPLNATIADGDATGTILDDEDPVALSVGDLSVSEGDPGSSVTLDFPVTIAGPTTTKPVIVDYVTVMNGTASGSDYVEAIGFATFPAGAPSGVISIQIKEDLHVESDETFDLALSTPLNATIADGDATGTILDDEDQVSLSVGDPSVAEGDPGDTVVLQFPITIAGGPTTKSVRITYATVLTGSASGADFQEASGSQSFPAGAASGVIVIPITEDLLSEGDETFNLTLSMPRNTTIADGDATGTILDDEDQVSLSVGDPSVAEGDPGDTVTLDFPVTIAGATTTKPVSVDYTTVLTGSASGGDFEEAAGNASFAAGVSNGVISIQITEDLLPETDETFDLALSTPLNTTISDGDATGTILDDEDQVSLSIGDPSVNEGDPGDTVTLDFPITITGGPTTKPVSVDYATVLTGSAASNDFEEATGNASFAAGESSGVISIQITEDLHVESDETFDLTLSAPLNTTIADGDATGTILDDEDQVSLSVGDPSVAEGDPGDTVTLDFPVTIAGATTTKPVSVDYATVLTGSAASNDFEEATGNASFAAGESSGVISIQIVEDPRREENETFDLTVSAPLNTTITDGDATGTILDDDEASVPAMGGLGLLALASILAMIGARGASKRRLRSDGSGTNS